MKSIIALFSTLLYIATYGNASKRMNTELQPITAIVSDTVNKNACA